MGILGGINYWKPTTKVASFWDVEVQSGEKNTYLLPTSYLLPWYGDVTREILSQWSQFCFCRMLEKHACSTLPGHS